MTPSAIVRLMEFGSNKRGKAGEAKKASRTALVDHSVSAGGQKTDQLIGANRTGDFVILDQGINDQIAERRGHAGGSHQVEALDRVARSRHGGRPAKWTLSDRPWRGPRFD